MLVCFFACDESRYVNGQCLVIDKGAACDDRRGWAGQRLGRTLRQEEIAQGCRVYQAGTP